MYETVKNYLRAKKIDSFQKLRLLLHLHCNPGLKGTSQELADQLHWGDAALVEKFLAELQRAGLIDRKGDHYRLIETLEVKTQLQHLTKAFEHPLIRQELLNQLKYRPNYGAHRANLTRPGWSLN